MSSEFVGKPGFGFVREIDRPSRAAVEAIGQHAAAPLSDALGRGGCMDPAIRPLSPGMRMFGPAITVDAWIGDHLMNYTAMRLAQPGDVLVINAHGDLNHRYWGEIATRVALSRLLAGVVIDGGTADVREIRELGLQMFVRGITLRCGLGSGPGMVNVPISCGGVIVNPGDIVVADDDGVVVVPKDKIETTLEGVRAKAELEERVVAAIERGEPHPPYLEDVLRREGVLGEHEHLERLSNAE